MLLKIKDKMPRKQFLHVVDILTNSLYIQKFVM